MLAAVTRISPFARALRCRTANAMSRANKVTSAGTLYRTVCSPKATAAYAFALGGAHPVPAALAPVTQAWAPLTAVACAVQSVRAQQHVAESDCVAASRCTRETSRPRLSICSPARYPTSQTHAPAPSASRTHRPCPEHPAGQMPVQLAPRTPGAHLHRPVA